MPGWVGLEALLAKIFPKQVQPAREHPVYLEQRGPPLSARTPSAEPMVLRGRTTSASLGCRCSSGPCRQLSWKLLPSLICGSGELLWALSGGRSRQEDPFRSITAGQGGAGASETKPLSCAELGAGLPSATTAAARTVAAQWGPGGGQVQRRCPSPPVLKCGPEPQARPRAALFPTGERDRLAVLPGSPPPALLTRQG